jgi:hypothetical protein
MAMQVTYMEALLLEQISQGRAEVILNRTPGSYYVNDRQADEGIVPYLESLYEDGLLDKEALNNEVTYYVLNDNGREALEQSLALSNRPC